VTSSWRAGPAAVLRVGPHHRYAAFKKPPAL
jgi:hypothetical protein